jgi:hypothetical protein
MSEVEGSKVIVVAAVTLEGPMGYAQEIPAGSGSEVAAVARRSTGAIDC